MVRLELYRLVCAIFFFAWVFLVSAVPVLAPRDDKESMHGVNLGGWLVLEPWITPSLFEEAGEAAVDEYTWSKTLAGNAKSRLTKHWDSWISSADFEQIAAAGLTHVRIPIGYWAVAPVDGEPYVQGQIDYLDKAIGWARDSNLKVIVDLHGAPGSQNGFDNSGRRGPINWQKGDTVKQTLRAIRALAARYAHQTDVVTAIELLNEPFVPGGVDLDALKQFYYDGFGIMREANENMGIAISDAFQPPDSWNGFMAAYNNFHNIYLDTHHYQVFDDALLALNTDQHANSVCSFGREKLALADKWTFVGEWSAARTDCAKYLNGRGVGSRFDGSFHGGAPSGACGLNAYGSVKELSAGQKMEMRRYIEAQLDAFEHGVGWFFWTWKTEGAPEWDMQELLEEGVFPQPLWDRKFGGCG
ncbi:hypothetical protein AJ79_00840 [Helicocarpus griseus UAMH5409]|uniref:glucan 1,3-beta-glucosidase n=1 Tax=Helicocarpus griseus UAMH5409 TaxID=1447875 RepID=A0A2B7YA57_9EURO|nr:hypothetical protein AJ79_00840 [Helicocarpus griseus UAMH5409]